MRRTRQRKLAIIEGVKRIFDQFSVTGPRVNTGADRLFILILSKPFFAVSDQLRNLVDVTAAIS
jgi:hypothetical protein